MAYILGAVATAAAIWATLHDGNEEPKRAKRDWQIAGVIILCLGAIAGASFL